MDNAKRARLNEIVVKADALLNHAAEVGRELPPDGALITLSRLIHDLARTVHKLAIEVRDTEANPKPPGFGRAVR